MKKLWRKLPPFIRNKYVLVIFFFIGWMLFFDDYTVVNQYQMRTYIDRQNSKIRYYDQLIEETKATQHDLSSNMTSLEKFGRENYWMKKDDEDIFIIVEKN